MHTIVVNRDHHSSAPTIQFRNPLDYIRTEPTTPNLITRPSYTSSADVLHILNAISNRLHLSPQSRILASLLIMRLEKPVRPTYDPYLIHVLCCHICESISLPKVIPATHSILVDLLVNISDRLW